VLPLTSSRNRGNKQKNKPHHVNNTCFPPWQAFGHQPSQISVSKVATHRYVILYSILHNIPSVTFPCTCTIINLFSCLYKLRLSTPVLFYRYWGQNIIDSCCLNSIKCYMFRQNGSFPKNYPVIFIRALWAYSTGKKITVMQCFILKYLQILMSTLSFSYPG